MPPTTQDTPPTLSSAAKPPDRPHGRAGSGQHTSEHPWRQPNFFKKQAEKAAAAK